jgi:DNA (cytosine-5)-methyltransferase 1
MNYKLIKYCEFDKYAYKSYDAIHNTTQDDNLGDIYNADFKVLPQSDLIVGGSPCQDFSISGKQKGSIWICNECEHKYNPLEQHWSKRKECPNCNSEDIDKSRSSLVVEYLRAIRENKPKFFIYENVKNIISSKHKITFDLFIKELHEYGYKTYYEVLNAKHYNIPQNRERVFVVGIRNDIDKGFIFPKKMELQYKLKDVLEEVVDEKFYITDGILESLLEKGMNDLNFGIANNPRSREYNGFKEVSPTLCARDYKDPKCVQIGNVTGEKWDKMHESSRRIYSEDGIAPTVHTCQSGNSEPKVLKRVCEQRSDEGLRFFKDECVGTLRTIDSCGDKRVLEETTINKELRKLIPLECWRLMGFSDEDLYKAQKVGTSNSQLYKQAGNSIVVDVLVAICKELKRQYSNDFCEDISLISLFSGIGAFEKALEKL